MARITLGFRIYPDIDDTAIVVLALLEAGHETEVQAARGRVGSAPQCNHSSIPA